MDDSPNRRYYPEEENVPLSEAVLEAARAHDASLTAEEFTLYEHTDPESLDTLITDAPGADVSVRIDLPDATVEIWSDGGIDIRVTD